MAITTATRSTYGNMLRYVYTPKLWKLQNRDRILFQILKKDQKQYAEGQRIEIPLHTAGTGGIGWSSSGSLPTPGRQETSKAWANYKRLYGRFKIDGALIASTRTGYASEVRALEFEARQLVDDLAQDLHFQLWGNSSGKLGYNFGSHSTPASGNFSIDKAACGLRKNQICDIDDVTGGGDEEMNDVLIVSMVTHASDSTKWDVVTDGTGTDGTWDDGGEAYNVFPQGSEDDVVDGLQTYIADAPTNTVLGINRATAANAFWRNQYMGNGGTNREITFELMQEMIDMIETNSPGTPGVIITTHAIWRKIAKILSADKRYPGEMTKLKGWCNAVQFAGMPPIVRDKHCPEGHMYFLDLNTWTIYQDSEGGFIDEDGQILRLVENSDAFQAAWRRFIQLVCHDPASNGVIFDISE